jgi:hypothetical protein
MPQLVLRTSVLHRGCVGGVWVAAADLDGFDPLNPDGITNPFGPGRPVRDANRDRFVTIDSTAAMSVYLRLKGFDGESKTTGYYKLSMSDVVISSYQTNGSGDDFPVSFGLFGIQAAGRQLAVLADLDVDTPPLFGLDGLDPHEPVDVIEGVMFGTQGLVLLDVTGLDFEGVGAAITEYTLDPSSSNRLYTGQAWLTDAFAIRVTPILMGTSSSQTSIHSLRTGGL